MDLPRIAIEGLAFWPGWLFAVAACFAAWTPMSVGDDCRRGDAPNNPGNFLTRRSIFPPATAVGVARCGPHGPVFVDDKLTQVRRFKRKLTD